jgi:hypothetical protein
MQSTASQKNSAIAKTQQTRTLKRTQEGIEANVDWCRPNIYQLAESSPGAAVWSLGNSDRQLLEELKSTHSRFSIQVEAQWLEVLMFAALNVDAMVRSSLPHCGLFP